MKVLTGVIVMLLAISTYAADKTVFVEEGASLIVPDVQCPAGQAAMLISKPSSQVLSINVEVSCQPIVCVVNKIATDLDKVSTYGPLLGLLEKNKLQVSMVFAKGRETLRRGLIVKKVDNKEFDSEADAKELANKLMNAGKCNSVITKGVVY